MDTKSFDESYDQMKLIQGMAETALARSQRQDTLDSAKVTCKITKNLAQRCRQEGAKYNITQKSTMSASSRFYLQKLKNISDDNFDVLYACYMKIQLSNLILQLIQSGRNKQIVAFSSSTLARIEKLAKELTNNQIPYQETF